MSADTTRQRRYVSWREFDAIIHALKQALSKVSLPDVAALTARVDVIEHTTNHHVERLETFAPALVQQARLASAKADVLIARLETAIAEQEAWRERDLLKTRAILDRDILGRLSWLFTGR